MTDILEHRRMVDALQSTIDEQKHALDILEKALAAREQAAKALQANLEDHKTRNADLADAICTHEHTITDLQSKLVEQDRITAALRGELAQAAEARITFEATAAYKLSLALTLANTAYDALMVLDENQRVIAINTSAETLFERERPIGERLGSVTGSPEIEMMVDDALANQEESYEEQIIINKRTYRVRAQVIPRDGHTFIGLALQDITELVRLNRARRDMVANISHELRTPIANIRLTIDSIFHEQAKPKGKASRSALKAIARETDSLLWLVQELLDLSMIESGQAILRMVDVPADLLVDEAIARLHDQSEFKNIVITGSVPEAVQ